MAAEDGEVKVETVHQPNGTILQIRRRPGRHTEIRTINGPTGTNIQDYPPATRRKAKRFKSPHTEKTQQ